MSVHRTLTVTLAASALILAACGSDGGTDAGDGQTAAGDSAYGLANEGVLVVGTEGTYRPFSYHEGGSGELVGYDIEVVEAVAEKLDLEIEYQETQWDAIFAGLEAGRFDVIANQVSINPQREEAYLFSEPYTVSPGVIVVANDTTDIAGLDDLEGKTTAQSLTSNWGEIAEGAGANVEAVEGWAQSVALLEQGRVDATVNDKLTFLDYTNEHPDSPIKIAAELDEASLNAFAFGKDKTELVSAFDEALAELEADGTLAELGEKYFGADVSH
ncbi:amino acid ABC transporter substrate-binding protein [Ornithinimicrobium sp. F0845]|uniref:amino acid ABC transporter substrate-binding protein n=1 Tax=Ornithinimicrobium sp. F0845 TaxID=2926412 RepID=UPI001FF4010E|nr:amino acid ABC transporter substrate-binding protein [Ornithinimicrobium sp. F0845]MCK0114197.1 amino acid ABC transporter substrate-binding protein [Ornithinimicrobium sp. F0845]